MALSVTGPGHLTQRQLESTLWAAANALRGPVDPGDFKAYVFPVMFFKWVSDNWDYRHAQAVTDFGDDLTEEIEADYHPFAIPDGCHWKDVYETSVNVGAKLARCLQRMAPADRRGPERLPERRLRCRRAPGRSHHGHGQPPGRPPRDPAKPCHPG